MWQHPLCFSTSTCIHGVNAEQHTIITGLQPNDYPAWCSLYPSVISCFYEARSLGETWWDSQMVNVRFKLRSAAQVIGNAASSLNFDVKLARSCKLYSTNDGWLAETSRNNDSIMGQIYQERRKAEAVWSGGVWGFKKVGLKHLVMLIYFPFAIFHC